MSFKLQLRRGFSLFELMVVITIMGITMSVITASFLTFQRNQVVKNAASTMKNDIRLAQSKALSGDKGPGGLCSNDPSLNQELVGWYVNIVKGASTYQIAGDCHTSSNEVSFYLSVGSSKPVTLPQDLTVSSISYPSWLGSSVNILFQPLSQNVTFWDASLSPPFWKDANGNLKTTSLLGGTTSQSALTITLANSQGNTYNVIIQPTGEVNESSKP